jgi:hypothetical protein
MFSIGQRLNSSANSFQSAASNLQSIQEPTQDRPNRINTLTLQLDNLNNSLTDLQSSVTQAQHTLSSYFNPIKLAVILAIAGLMGLGAIFLLIGLSLFILRRRTIRLVKHP